MTSFEVLLIVVLVVSFNSLENRIERQSTPLPPPFIPPEDDWPPPMPPLPHRKLQPGEKTLGDLLSEALNSP